LNDFQVSQAQALQDSQVAVVMRLASDKARGRVVIEKRYFGGGGGIVSVRVGEGVDEQR